jgi:hypothetical protein
MCDYAAYKHLACALQMHTYIRCQLSYLQLAACHALNLHNITAVLRPPQVQSKQLILAQLAAGGCQLEVLHYLWNQQSQNGNTAMLCVTWGLTCRNPRMLASPGTLLQMSPGHSSRGCTKWQLCRPQMPAAVISAGSAAHNVRQW